MLEAKQFKVIECSNEISVLWDVYDNAMNECNKHTVQNQKCFGSLEIFKEVLFDDTYWKFVLYKDNSPVGLALMTNNLDHKFAYWNKQFYLNNISSEYTSNNKLYCVTALCIKKEFKGKISPLLRLICRFVNQNNLAVTFDYGCKNKYLTNLIEKIGIKFGSNYVKQKLDYQEFDIMYYTK